MILYLEFSCLHDNLLPFLISHLFACLFPRINSGSVQQCYGLLCMEGKDAHTFQSLKFWGPKLVHAQDGCASRTFFNVCHSVRDGGAAPELIRLLSC